MRNKNICLELKMDRVFYFAARRETGGDGSRRTGERSAAFALPARHAAPTADVYVLTVGLFYRGLSEDVFS